MLGIGLAMDAFSVSLANGLAEPQMNIARTTGIACVYAVFQFVMPMTGWFLVTRAAERFEAFRPLIPWIALAFLLLIGGEMLKDGISERFSRGNGSEDRSARKDSDADGCEEVKEGGYEETNAGITASVRLGFAALMMQGIATSIDALSVGFTISEYDLSRAVISSLIIGAVTFGICFAGLRIGRRLGTMLAGRASILGGVILIGIGLEIWIKGVFF